MQMPEGGGALMTSVLSSFLLPWCTCNAFKHNCKSTCNFIYNFQRWMSRFDQRWRAQRSAISIVNCRIPWTDRDLNAYCAFGISLKACLLQCLCFVVPAALPHQALLLRVLVPQDAHLGALEASSWQGYASTASLLSICLLSVGCVRGCGVLFSLACMALVPSSYDMKLGQQTRWI